jgi:DNA-binding MarR family transcriptional regulator
MYNEAMEKHNLQDNLYWQLLQALFRIKPTFMRLAEAEGMTLSHLYVVGSMQVGAAVLTSSVSSLLACDASNATNIVDRLVEQGYVSRRENPQDRRQKLIVLTERGRLLQGRILQAIPAYEVRGFADLNPAEKQQLSGLLARVLEVPHRP